MCFNQCLITFLLLLATQSEAKKLYRRVTHLRSEQSQIKYQRGCCFGLCGRKVDLVDHYGKKLEDLEENVRLEQSEASFTGQVSVGDSFSPFIRKLLFTF